MELILQCYAYDKSLKTFAIKYLVVNKQTNTTYFVKEYSNASAKYTENDIINMINFLIDNIYVEFGDQIYQQTIGIPMGTNCAPLLADLFLYL